MKAVIEIKELCAFLIEIVHINSQQATINKQKCYSIEIQVHLLFVLLLTLDNLKQVNKFCQASISKFIK